MKRKIIAALAIATFGIAGLTGTAGAKGPGKPGQNALAPGGNIVEVAVAANDALGVFDTLLAAVQCQYFEGGVVDLLAGDGMLTVFAPTDSAFAALGLDESNVCTAFETDPGALADVLTYHVTDGRRSANSVFNARNAKSIGMLNGGSITANPDLTLTDASPATADAAIVAPYFNLNASNGVIHVIDQVLLPAGS